MTIKGLCKLAHENAKEKGFWDEIREVGTLLMLIVSELGEALEAHRKNKFANINKKINFEKDIKDTFEDEISDVFIRLGDLCGGLNINIEKHIKMKMKYNKKREKLHGKKY